MAHFVAARITALRPGQSPPPVEMPIVKGVIRHQSIVSEKQHCLARSNGVANSEDIEVEKWRLLTDD